MDKPENAEAEKDVFAFDLENRLDDFFSDEGPAKPKVSPPSPPVSPQPEIRPVAAVAEKPVDVPKNPFLDLKSTILSIDWEITDAGLTTFINQIDTLMGTFSTDKVITPLLKILKTLGIYIRKYKSRAHPEAIKRLMTTYSCLELITENTALGMAEKNRMLHEQIVKFKRFKEKIAPKKVAAAAAQAANAGGEVSAVTLDAIMDAVETLRALVMEELAAIRKELETIRKQ